MITKPVDGWAMPDGAVYGVLFDADRWREFVDAIVARDDHLERRDCPRLASIDLAADPATTANAWMLGM